MIKKETRYPLTTTLNGGYGSRTVVGGAGFLLNNEMDDFSVKPGVPNMYGAIGGEANAIVPGKRMLSSMTPAIVLKKRCTVPDCWNAGRHHHHHIGFSNTCKRVGIRYEHGRCRL